MTHVSIITVTLNNLAGLKQTVASVATQTYTDYQYIVIDGGSTDGTLEYLRSQTAITQFISEKDTGIYDAMNKGIALATGEYLLFLNAGDYLVDAKVLSGVFSKEHAADIILGQIVKQVAGQPLDYCAQDYTKLRLATRCCVAHPAAFIRRTLFQTVGYYDMSYRIAADYDFFVRAILLAGASVQCLSLHTTVFDTTGVSNQITHKYQEAQEVQRVLALVPYGYRFISWLGVVVPEHMQILVRRLFTIGDVSRVWRFILRRLLRTVYYADAGVVYKAQLRGARYSLWQKSQDHWQLLITGTYEEVLRFLPEQQCQVFYDKAYTELI